MYWGGLVGGGDVKDFTASNLELIACFFMIGG